MDLLDKSIPELGDSLKAGPLGSLNFRFKKAYVLGEEIGQGSYGVVYKTHHVLNPAEQFAVKVERKNKCVVEEVKILRSLINVPHVIQLKDFYCYKKQMFSVIDLAEGGDVLDKLAQDEFYTEHDARELAKILLTTISDIHDRRIVHRDLKLENLLLKSGNDNSSIIVCDFGFAAFVPEENEDNGLQTLKGTAEYTAPEMWNKERYGKKVDMWSIGCILYILLSGIFPFGDDRKGDLVCRIIEGDYDFEDENWGCVSPNAKETVSKLLEVDPSKRWTAEEALESKWFTRSSARNLRRASLNSSLESLKKLNRHRKFKKVYNAVTACKFMQKSLTETHSISNPAA